MKSFRGWVQVSMVALVVVSILANEVEAQMVTGRVAQSEASDLSGGQASKEAKSMQLLDTSLRSLSDRAHRGRRIGGYVLLGLGIGSGVGGATVLAVADNDDERVVGYSLLGGAALFSGLSLLPFKITTESERFYREFSEIPAKTPEQIRQKFYYGDRHFEELAERRRRERLISASISVIVGVANLFWTDLSEETRLSLFTGPLIGGVVELLTKSEEEREYESYRRAVEDVIGHCGGLDIHFGLVPFAKEGMFYAMRVEF